MIATDTASYSDIVFGMFRLLGYRFSPRIADLADQRYWRATLPGAPDSDYGPLNARCGCCCWERRRGGDRPGRPALTAVGRRSCLYSPFVCRDID